MAWQIEFTDEFGAWFEACSEAVQDDVDRTVRLLEERGPNLPHPHSSGVNGSAYDHMRELRLQSGGRPIRIFYAFDPRRTAILLVGGDKTGDDRFYQIFVPQADRLYAAYLDEIRREGLDPMTGHRSFNALRARMSPERRERNIQAGEALSHEMTLQELRALRQRSQGDVAKGMSVLQPAVAKLERRGDMYVSNLARYIESLGGKLVITAEFPEQSMTLRLGGRGDEPAPADAASGTDPS